MRPHPRALLEEVIDRRVFSSTDLQSALRVHTPHGGFRVGLEESLKKAKLL